MERTVFDTPPGEIDREYANEFRATAKQVRETKSHVAAAVSKALECVYEKLAEEIREKKMAGDMSDQIADALITGAWEGCAI
jgi:hypothetical protein